MASTPPAVPRATGPRGCSRTGCRHAATASLSFRYASSQVWLLDLSGRPDPSLYDLCTDHADALTVPRGWERVDERSPAPPPEAPAAPTHDGPPPARGRRLHGAGPEEAADPRPAPHPPVHRSSRPPNRYAALSAELPRLAAQLAGDVPPRPHGADAAEPAAADRAGASPGPTTRHLADRRPAVRHLDDHGSGGAAGAVESLGPRPAPARPATESTDRGDTRVAVPAGGPAEASESDDGGPPPEVDGQLALGVELGADPAARLDHEGAAAREPVGAVVVPIGARRREHLDAGDDAPPPGRPPFKA